MGAGEPGGKNLLRLLGKPGVGALGGEELGNGLNGPVRHHRLAAVLAVDHGDGQTPAALAGNAPVGALPDHGLHPVDAPLGHPADLVGGGAGLVLKGIHGTEPLGRGPEDDGALAAPAVRVAVDDVLRGEEHAALLHVRQDDGVALVRGHSHVLPGVVRVPALVVHGDHHVHAIALAGLVVVRAEARGGVHAARAGIHGDVIRQHQAAGLRQEGVVRQHIFEEAAGMGLRDLPGVEAAQFHHLLHQGLRHDIVLAVGGLHNGIALRRVQGDGQVAGEGPDGGGPDHEEEGFLVKGPQFPLVVVHGEFHIDGGAGVLLILDLGLRQGSLVVGAPVDGLQALVDIALFIHLPEDLHLLGLKAGVHGEVGVVPVPHHADALEGVPLDVHIVGGEVMAGGAELGDAHGLVVQLVFLDDGGFDGHSVVVPAGDVGGVVPPHGVGPGDDVLDGLVHGRSHVDGPVGERGAVVEVEEGLALVLFEELVVDVLVLPALEHLRLPLGQSRPHGEVGLRQADGFVVVHFVLLLYNITICALLSCHQIKNRSLSARARCRRCSGTLGQFSTLRPPVSTQSGSRCRSRRRPGQSPRPCSCFSW